MSASVRWDLALEVARWEFRRFAKPKQLLWSLIIALVSASVGFGVVRLLDNDDERVQLAVVGEPIAGAVGDTLGERFAIRHAASDELPVLREAVAGGDLDGLLMRADTGAVQLFLGGRAGWRSDLEAALGAARQQARLAESGIAPEQLAHVFE